MSDVVFGKFGKHSEERFIKQSVQDKVQEFLLNGDEVEKFDFLCDLHESVEFNEMLFEMIKAGSLDVGALDDTAVDVVSFALDALRERFDKER